MRGCGRHKQQLSAAEMLHPKPGPRDLPGTILNPVWTLHVDSQFTQWLLIYMILNTNVEKILS